MNYFIFLNDQQQFLINRYDLYKRLNDDNQFCKRIHCYFLLEYRK